MLLNSSKNLRIMLKLINSKDLSTSKDPRNSYKSTRRMRSSKDSSYCINKISTLTFLSASSNIAKMYEVSLSLENTKPSRILFRGLGGTSTSRR